jgi:hypothetical protein
MRAIVCYSDMEVAKSLEGLFRQAGLDVSEVEPEVRSSTSGKLLRVSDGGVNITVSVCFSDVKLAKNQLESRIIVFVPWKWKDYLMRRDPQGTLGARIRSILEKQTVGRIAIDDLMTRRKKDTTSDSSQIPRTGQIPE